MTEDDEDECEDDGDEPKDDDDYHENEDHADAHEENDTYDVKMLIMKAMITILLHHNEPYYLNLFRYLFY